MDIAVSDPTAPDPGPQPQSENLAPEQIVAKCGRDLTDEVVTKIVMDELVYDRRLSIAAARKSKAEREAQASWQAAYMKRFGTDEG